MLRHVTITALVIGALVGGDAWAQRAGGRGGGAPGGGGGRGSAPPGADDKARAENIKQWAADIERLRAQSPPPPLPQIRFPSQNEVLLGRLRSAEDPKHALTEYLDKLWKDGKDATAQRLAFEQFWRDAEKPKWARAATEDYYQKHANAALKPATPSKAPEPVTLSKPPEPATLSKPPEAGPAPEPATLPPSSSTHQSE
jgi:hypothetical protein